MANKVYVEIIPIAVKADDSALKSKLAAQIKDAFEKAIEASGALTKKAPADKKEKGFSLDIDFTLKTKGTEIEGELNIAFSIRPKKAIFGHAKQGAGGSSMRELDGVMDAILEKLVPKVIAQLKAQIPKLADV